MPGFMDDEMRARYELLIDQGLSAQEAVQWIISEAQKPANATADLDRTESVPELLSRNIDTAAKKGAGVEAEGGGGGGAAAGGYRCAGRMRRGGGGKHRRVAAVQLRCRKWLRVMKSSH